MQEETRKRIQFFEEIPPSSVWNNIAASLDQIEQTGTGNNAGESLPGSRTKRTATIFNFPAWTKYAAVLVLLAGTVFLWKQVRQSRIVDKEFISSSASSDQPTDTPENRITMLSPQTEETFNSSITGQSNSLPGAKLYVKNQQKAYIAANIHPVTPIQYYNTERQFSAYHPDQSSRSLGKLLASNAIPDDTINENYIYLTSGDGQQLRISRKLANSVLCEWGLIDSHSPADYNQLLQLSEKMNQWKSRIASTSFIPCASNMMDMLGLIDMLEEN